jgi:hypothetical protein
VNQRLTPNDASAHGSWWESLGVCTINSGTLTVRLTDNADGKVVADAIWASLQGSASAAGRAASSGYSQAPAEMDPWPILATATDSSSALDPATEFVDRADTVESLGRSLGSADWETIYTDRVEKEQPPEAKSAAYVAAADLFFSDLELGSQEDSDNTDPLATPTADVLALMAVE